MNQYPVFGINNGERESFLPQTDSNYQSENSNKNSRNPESVSANLPRINPSTINRFYRTEMCRIFLQGKCFNGDRCTYAHDYKDLKPKTQELVKTPSGFRQICYQWKYKGRCNYTDKCRFFHGLSEVKTSVERMESGREEQEQPAKSMITVPQQEGEAKGFAKLANKKLKGIYGDWIDEK